MTESHGTFQMQAPRDMYTMPEQRTMHFLSDDQLTLIEQGDHSILNSWCIFLAGIAIGFLHDALLAAWAVVRDKPIGKWNGAALVVFSACAFAALTLHLSFSKQGSPLKRLVAEIKARQRRPISAQT